MSATVTLLGREWPVRPPPGGEGFTLAEAWVAVKVTQKNALRVAGAAVGIGTDACKGVCISDFDFDILKYGGECYGRLRLAGATATEVSTAASPCFQLLNGMVAPRESEVKKKVAFSKAGGDSPPPPSGSPSITAEET